MGIAQFVPTKISEQQDFDTTGMAANDFIAWDGSKFVPSHAFTGAALLAAVNTFTNNNIHSDPTKYILLGAAAVPDIADTWNPGGGKVMVVDANADARKGAMYIGEYRVGVSGDRYTTTIQAGSILTNGSIQINGSAVGTGIPGAKPDGYMFGVLADVKDAVLVYNPLNVAQDGTLFRGIGTNVTSAVAEINSQGTLRLDNPYGGAVYTWPQLILRDTGSSGSPTGALSLRQLDGAGYIGTFNNTTGAQGNQIKINSGSVEINTLASNTVTALTLAPASGSNLILQPSGGGTIEFNLQDTWYNTGDAKNRIYFANNGISIFKSGSTTVALRDVSDNNLVSLTNSTATFSGGISASTATLSGNLTLSGLTASQFLETDGTKNVVSKSASSFKADLNLVIGSDVQAYSANLDTVAAVSVNSFGAGFLAESTALQMRTYFGLDYLYSGTGSPEGAVTAPVGSRYRRDNGGAGTCLYVKESGVGNTGWVAYASGQGAVPAGGTIAYVLTKNSGTDFDYSWAAVPGSGGGGTVTSVSVVTANGISGTVATSTSTPAITLALGAITPTTVVASGNISGANLTGTNTGDQTITLTGDVTGTGTGSFGATIAANAVTLSKFQQIATASILGRNTASTGNIEVLSATTVKSLLGLVIGTNVQAWDADLDAFALKTAPTGAVVGDTDTQTLSAKTLTAPVINGATAASGNLDFSGSTGTFKTSTGANTLGGAVTISAATPSLTTASGQTNTGFVLVQGKTSGGLKLLPVDAAGQTVTVSLAAQTVGASTLTIPDFANVSDTFAFIGLAQTLTNKTLTSPKINENVALTTTATKLNFLTSAAGTTGTASTNIVFSTSPTLVTPTLGAATATSVNKWAFTAPSTAATLTAGADNLTYTLPDITCNIGFREIPQNSKSANYTTVLTDNGKHIYHPSADTTARTFTIDSNVNVAYPVGTAIVFINDSSAGVLTIAISSDTLVQAGTGSTGSRTLAANGRAMAIKVAATRWQIDGNGLT